jgi:hypothetical protein
MQSPSHIILGLAALLAAPASAQPKADNPLVGTWVIDRFVNAPEGGEPDYPFGKQPVGTFIFTADGHFSFNVMRGARREEDTAIAADANAEWVPSWYLSYFGTYRYNPSDPSWTGRVLGGNIASYIGTEQTRRFKIEGNVMTISAAYEDNGRKIRAERVLRKVAQ